MEGRVVVVARCAESKEVLVVKGIVSKGQLGENNQTHTSAVLGTLSQNTSILMSPWDV